MFKRLLPVLFALTALPAGATTTFYIGNASEAAFNTAAGVALSYFNFSGYAGILPATTLAESNTGINFASFFSNGSSPTNLALSGTALSQSTSTGGTGSNIVFDLPGTVRIIGMHLFATAFGTYCVDAPGGTDCSSTQFGLDATPSFLGVITTDASLGDFQIRHMSGGSSMLFRIADVGVSAGASAVPEPSTMALVGGGLILFPLIARRKRRS